jgi:hypothetical protein
MPRPSRRTSFEARVLITDYAAQGLTDPQIATRLGCAVWTVRKWRRRVHHAGRAVLTSHFGRPRSGPLGTWPADLPTALRQLRDAHPGWGPLTLLAALRDDPYWRTQSLPSRARVAAWLRQAGLTRHYQRHADLPQPTTPPAGMPHAEWQLDAQGPTAVPNLGTVSVINVVDVVSRVKVESCPRTNCRKPAADDYYVTLRRAFTAFGLPQRLSLDHDTVFFDNTTPSPFPTRLHLWLIALGVEVVFIRKRRPTDHAVVERTHQTMYHQALDGQQWAAEDQLWRGLDSRRRVLNSAIPIRALANQAPLVAYPQARTTGQPYRPEWEADLLDLHRVHDYLAQGRWFLPVHAGVFHLGTQLYYLGKQIDKQTVEIHFDPTTIELVCQPETGEAPIRQTPKGLTKAYLMGALANILALPVYQLALPWSVETRRHADLIASLTGTTG